MARRVLKCANVFLAALVVGTMFGIWLGFNPSSLSASAYVEQQQEAIRSLNVAMPVLGAISIALTLAHAVWASAAKTSRRFLFAAAVCFLFSGLVTRFGNQPINREVMTWSAQSPPRGWQEERDMWWRWHVVRTTTGVLGLGLLIVATIVGVGREAG